MHWQPDGTAAEAAGMPGRMLRRSLLLGIGAAGIWLVGSLGHAATAEAAAATTPSHPASQVQQLVTSLLGPEATKPAVRPLPLVKPLPVVNSLVKQAQSRATTVLTQTVPATVDQVVSTVTGTTSTLVGSLPVPVPVAPITTPDPAPPVATVPILSTAGVHPASPVVPNKLTNAAHPGRAAGVEPSVQVLVASDRSAVHAVPALHSARLAGSATPVRVTSASPAGTPGHGPSTGFGQGGCAVGAVGSSVNAGPQPNLSMVCSVSLLANRPVTWTGTNSSAGPPPRERATAPAVSPD